MKKSLLLFVLLAPSLQAQSSGTWAGTTSGGNWSDTLNWSGGVVADGSGNTADFSTLDIPAGAFNVTLDAARTIGNLTFGDTDTGTAGTWGVIGANTLTLAGSAPTITTNVNVGIGGTTILSGSSGFTKVGSATLTISSASALTGNISLNAGTIAIGKNGSVNSGSLGTGAINMASGTTIRLTSTSAALNFVGNAISIADGANVTISSAAAGNGFSSLFAGNGTSVLNIVNNAGQAVSLSSSGTPQLASFLGTVNIASGNSLRFSSTSGPAGNGGANTTFDVNGSVVARNGSTAGSNVVLGALTGSGTLNGPSNSANTVIYRVGDKNAGSTFSGVIQNGGFAGASAALNKVGSATLTLSGASTYTGATTVSAGTLLVNGSLGGTNVAVNGGTIGGTGAIGGGVTVNSGASLSAGASIESLATGALTLNNGSTFVFEAVNNSATGADLLVANGALALTNVTLDLSGAALQLGLWTMGDKVTLVSYTGTPVTSGFAGFADDSYHLFGSKLWLFNYDDGAPGANFAGEATGTSFVTMSVVPEPGTALLGGLGLLALMRRRRK